MPAKSFHICDVLSITTGLLVSPSGIQSVYKILNFMTGDEIYTHQIPRVCDTVSAFLLEKYPAIRPFHDDLLQISKQPEWKTASVVEKYIVSVSARFCTGEHLTPYIELEPMPASSYLHIDPLKELCALAGDNKVIAVNVSTEA